MCLIAYSPSGRPPKQSLQNGLRENPDGWGYVFPENGRLVRRRGMTDERFWRLWKKDESRIGDGPVLWHARWATHGLLCKKNCHPMLLGEEHGEIAFAHNGILRMPDHAELSDTALFVQNVLNKAKPGFLKDQTIVSAIETFVKPGKAVFLDGTGDAVIINEYYGSWDNGVWYSNDGYRYTQRFWKDSKTNTNTIYDHCYYCGEPSKEICCECLLCSTCSGDSFCEECGYCNDCCVCLKMNLKEDDFPEYGYPAYWPPHGR